MRGAREHNLKNVDVAFPRDRLVVITGLSGSGKSSLAFDTIYAEGQRRYVESLSAYARQFLGQMEKPDVDQIDGLSPAISIDQKGASRNPRSTVGTVTEIYDHLRLLFARIGIPHCPNGHAIERQSRPADRRPGPGPARGDAPARPRPAHQGPQDRGRPGLRRRPAPGVRPRPGRRRDARHHRRAQARQVQAPLDRGRRRPLHRPPRRGARGRRARAPTAGRSTRRPARVIPDPDAGRLADSVETALRLGEGVVLIAPAPRDDEAPSFEERRYSEKFSCPYDGYTADELEPRSFSFNSPHGACPDCTGLGTKLEIDPDLVIPDRSKSLANGALVPWARMPTDALVAAQDPRGDLRVARLGLHGARPRPAARGDRLRPARQEGREGHRPLPARTAARTRTRRPSRASSPTSSGATARPTRTTSRPSSRSSWSPGPARPARAGGSGPRSSRSPSATGTSGTSRRCRSPTRSTWSSGLEATLDERERTIAHQLLKEIGARLGFLVDVGLDYLTLDRTSVTLSGGEAQRIRLATQIGTTLMGVLYILDEPSIGLHQRDNAKLIATLTRLRDLGNTVLVVEHDEETIRTADWVVDIGPGAGEHGGEIIANGPLEAVLAEPRSITGAFLRGERAVPDPGQAPEGQRQGAPGARARASTTCATSTCGSRSARSWRSPACRAAARARSSPRSCTGRSPASSTARASRSARTTRSRAPSTSTRSSRSTRARSGGRRARTRRPTSACSRRSASCSPGVPESRLRGYTPGPLQLQRQGRPLRALQGRRHPQDRDAVPARRLRPVRGLRTASATTARRSRSTTRASRSPTSSR